MSGFQLGGAAASAVTQTRYYLRSNASGKAPLRVKRGSVPRRRLAVHAGRGTSVDETLRLPSPERSRGDGEPAEWQEELARRAAARLVYQRQLGSLGTSTSTSSDDPLQRDRALCEAALLAALDHAPLDDTCVVLLQFDKQQQPPASMAVAASTPLPSSVLQANAESSTLPVPDLEELLPQLAVPGSNSPGTGPPKAAPSVDVAAATPFGVPHSILILSIVSGALTMASCIFNTLLPIYMVTELKMSMRSMGMFEGLLEAFSYLVRMFSGVVSDMMVSRKAAITLGFAMGAAAKFGMSGAAEVGALFASKAVDRLANGVQAAPRDALISDLSPPEQRSTCFGFAQSMRKWGSMTGALLTFFLMRASNNNYRAILLLAAATSAAATVAFTVFVPAHPRPQNPTVPRHNIATPLTSPNPVSASSATAERPALPASATSASNVAPGLETLPSPATSTVSSVAAAAPTPARSWLSQLLEDVRSMGSDFYRTLAVISMYGMGHISESLMEARALEVGVAKSSATLVVALLAAVVFLCAYPLGKLDDKYGPRLTFTIGMTALVLGDLTLAFSGGAPAAVFVACVFLGVHYSVLQGPLLGTVTRLSPPHLRGTALGIFYTVMALTAVVGNSIFGTVWHTYGAEFAFTLSAVMVSATLVALPRMLPARLAVPPATAAAECAPAPA